MPTCFRTSQRLVLESSSQIAFVPFADEIWSLRFLTYINLHFFPSVRSLSDQDTWRRTDYITRKHCLLCTLYHILLPRAPHISADPRAPCCRMPNNVHTTHKQRMQLARVWGSHVPLQKYQCCHQTSLRTARVPCHSIDRTACSLST